MTTIIIGAVGRFYTAHTTDEDSMPRVFKSIIDLEKYIVSQTQNFKLPIVWRNAAMIDGKPTHADEKAEVVIRVLTRYSSKPIVRIL